MASQTGRIQTPAGISTLTGNKIATSPRCEIKNLTTTARGNGIVINEYALNFETLCYSNLIVWKIKEKGCYCYNNG